MDLNFSDMTLADYILKKNFSQVDLGDLNWFDNNKNLNYLALLNNNINQNYKMQSYFTAIQPHLQDHVDIALIQQNQSLSSKVIASLGIDNLIYLKDLSSQNQDRVYLEEGSNYTCIAQSGNHNSCILGTENGSVQELNVQTKERKLLYKSDFKINSISNSSNKKLIAIASEESKCILLDLSTLKISKCRPGHTTGLHSASFSYDNKYLASIGKDNELRLYNIENIEQATQMFTYKICHSSVYCLRGDFNKFLSIYYAPGGSNLHIIELLNNRWEIRQSNFIKHREPIQLVKIIKHYIILTSSQNQLCLWNNKNEEKLVVVEDFCLRRVIEVGEGFWGCKNDGRIFEYVKKINQSIGVSQSVGMEQRIQNDKMQIQEQLNQDVINFGDDDEDQDEQEEPLKELYIPEAPKKSKADRLITCYPQEPITTFTSLHDSARYLLTNHSGYLIERHENEYQVRIQYQAQQSDAKTQLLFINKEITFCDMNAGMLVYANSVNYGVKFFKTTAEKGYSDLNEWQKQREKHWEQIRSVACAYDWVAVASQSEIKVLDVTGNYINSISFDRHIVAMSGYQNLLAVVYHETIPIDGSQCLAMQLFVINTVRQQTLKCSQCHVPLRQKSILKFFRFSNEGMLISQDSTGFIRVYSLETNTWTNVIVENVDDIRRIWLLGMNDYKLVYWRCTQLNPDPEVFPRLPVKQNRLGISISVEQNQRSQQHPYLMFERFCLDHEQSRSRLWHHLKQTRKETSPGYFANLSTIKSQVDLTKHHNQLDYKFFDIIEMYLDTPKTHQKALNAAKTLIRTIEAGRKLSDLFDSRYKLRPLAVELQVYFDQMEKELQYDAMQQMDLEYLKAEAEKSIKPKGSNNPWNKKKTQDISSIPSLNNSQMSNTSNFDNLSQRSTIKAKENGMKMANQPPMVTPQKQELVTNPFLKKNSSEENGNKSKQIQQQIEKFGIKKKVEVKRPATKF